MGIPVKLGTLLQTRFNLVGHERQERRNPDKTTWHIDRLLGSRAKNTKFAKEGITVSFDPLVFSTRRATTPEAESQKAPVKWTGQLLR